MKGIRWSWLLPVLQLICVLSVHIYDPHQYRVLLRQRRATGGIEYYEQNYPSPSGRISQGINFPAIVLDYPLREAYSPILYERNDYDTLIYITPKDIGFFFGVAIFWFWVGHMLDKSLGKNLAGTWPRVVRLAGLVCGVAFALLTAAYAAHMLALEFRPWRQIGTFGIVWAAVLIAYFGWRVMQELWPKEGSAPISPVTSL